MCKCLKFISNILDRNIFGLNTIENEIKECVICLEKMSTKQNKSASGEENVRALWCMHLFHTKCIHEWLVNNNTCPTCRAPSSPHYHLPLHQNIPIQDELVVEDNNLIPVNYMNGILNILLNNNIDNNMVNNIVNNIVNDNNMVNNYINIAT